ncbi:MAG: type III-B CRISPR module-associated protein Cmr5 [bacterium]
MLNLNRNKSIPLDIVNFLNNKEEILKKDKSQTEANKFSNLLITNGLINTLAYYNSKSVENKDIKEFYEKIIIEFLADKLKINNKQEIFQVLLNKKPFELLEITNFMLIFSNYLKYYIKKFD